MTIRINSQIIINTVILICVGIISRIIILNGAGSDYNQFIGWVGIIVMFWNAVSLKQTIGTYFSLAFMFEGAFYLLTLGQTFVHAIGIEPTTTLDLYVLENTSNLNTAYLFTILCLIALNGGILASLLRDKKNLKVNGLDFDEIDSTNMRDLGIILFAISVIPALIDIVNLAVAYSASGYAAAFDSIGGKTSWGKIFSYLSSFFIISIFMILAAYKDKKQKQLWVKCILIGLIGFNFAIGNRSEPVCYTMALLWFSRRTKQANSEKKGNALLLILVALLLILIVPVIGETRNTGDLSLSTVINSFTGKNSFWNTIIDSFTTLGWSAFPTLKIMELIPETTGFHFGQSYFFAILVIFPNLFGGTHISVKYAGLAEWLMKALHMNYGPGFSMPAEAYYNFGWFGILVMPILGYIIGRLLDERSDEDGPLQLFTKIACFVFLFSIPRRDTMTAIRNITYLVGIPTLIILYLRSRKAKS